MITPPPAKPGPATRPEDALRRCFQLDTIALGSHTAAHLERTGPAPDRERGGPGELTKQTNGPLQLLPGHKARLCRQPTAHQSAKGLDSNRGGPYTAGPR